MRELFTFCARPASYPGRERRKAQSRCLSGDCFVWSSCSTGCDCLFFFMLPGLHIKLMEGAGMKGCSVLEIK